MVLSPTSDSASGGVTRRRGRARRDRSAASARGEKGDLRELEQVQFGIWCCSPWYPELEVVHDQLQGVEQRFPESPWVFRHPNWLPLVRTYDCSRRMVVYDSRSMVAGDGTSAEIGLRARHFGAIADLVVTDSV